MNLQTESSDHGSISLWPRKLSGGEILKIRSGDSSGGGGETKEAVRSRVIVLMSGTAENPLSEGRSLRAV